MYKLLLLSTIFLTSCATITGSDRYNVAFQGDANTTVTYRTKEYSLPAIVPLKPESSPMVTFSRKCYTPKTIQLDTNFRVGATIFGNIFWLIIGVPVDIITGNAWTIDDTKITAPQLTPIANCK